MVVDEFTQTQVMGQRDRKQQPGHWPPGGGRRRRFGCGRGRCVVASVGYSWSRVGFVFPKPLSPKHRSTFLPLQHAATPILSVDWGLDNVTSRLSTTLKTRKSPGFTATDFFNKPLSPPLTRTQWSSEIASV